MEDLFLAHTAGMDTYAAGLRVAAKLLEDHVLDSVIEDRYSSFKSGIGADFENGKVDFTDFENYIIDKPQSELIAATKSGHLEQLKATINNYMFTVLGK